MTSNITHTSYVINFIDSGFSSSEILDVIKADVEKITRTIQIDSLIDWEIIFNIIYSSDQRNLIRLYKQHPSYKTIKQKELVIHIPIPLESIVSWGVEKGQLVKLPIQPDETKYCSYIEIDFKKFHNRNDYIIDSARKAITQCFEEGFIVNGTRVKIQ